MSFDRVSNDHDNQGEVNLRLSAEDFSGFDPDVQRVLRQVVASQQNSQQRQFTAHSSHLGKPARSLSTHGREMIQQPSSTQSGAGPPGSSAHHRTIPNDWQHQMAAQQPVELGLDDFGMLSHPLLPEIARTIGVSGLTNFADRQLLASREPPPVRAPYVPSDHYIPPVPAALPLSAAERLSSAPSSSLSSTGFSTAPTLSSSRLSLPSSFANPDVRTAPTRTFYSPAIEPQPAAWRFHETVQRNATPSFGHSSLPASRQPSQEKQSSESREPTLVTQQFAPRHHCKSP